MEKDTFIFTYHYLYSYNYYNSLKYLHLLIACIFSSYITFRIVIYLCKSLGMLLSWVLSASCLDAIESFAVCSVLDLEWKLILQWCFLDRYVILGGHRDSWVFGGIDPQSGAAVVHEIVRSFGKLKKEGNISKK